MLTPSEVQRIADLHEQIRQYSCFQSAVEIVLKFHGILGDGEHPEQDIPSNDTRGFEPFAGKTKSYGLWDVSFEERKFESISPVAFDQGRALLHEGVYPIYSFMWPDGSGFHGFVGFRDEMDGISFITKKHLGRCRATRLSLMEIALSQKKTEILVMRVTKKPNQGVQ